MDSVFGKAKIRTGPLRGWGGIIDAGVSQTPVTTTYRNLSPSGRYDPADVGDLPAGVDDSTPNQEIRMYSTASPAWRLD